MQQLQLIKQFARLIQEISTLWRSPQRNNSSDPADSLEDIDLTELLQLYDLKRNILGVLKRQNIYLVLLEGETSLIGLPNGEDSMFFPIQNDDLLIAQDFLNKNRSKIHENRLNA